MFTTVKDPVTGHTLQFMTEFDLGKGYEVGDTIPWTPETYWPGLHIDGAHSSIDLDLSGTHAAWVVIKDATIVAVVKDEDIPVQMDAQEWLCDKYEIGPSDPSLWSEEAWIRKEIVQHDGWPVFTDTNIVHVVLSLLQKHGPSSWYSVCMRVPNHPDFTEFTHGSGHEALNWCVMRGYAVQDTLYTISPWGEKLLSLEPIGVGKAEDNTQTEV